MRLIDADAMLKRLEKWNRSDSNDKAFYNFCLNRIIEQPTAYDVENVVEEIKELRVDDNYECIDIVKKGGVK